MSVGIPSLFVFIALYSPEELKDFEQMLQMAPTHSDDITTMFIELIINSIMPSFFAIIPVMASSVMAASSFVGEKEKKTLETLLYSPLPLKEIFYAKVMASFALSMAVSYAAFFAMVIVVEIELLLAAGIFIMPGASWLSMMLIVSPSISLLAITVIVRGSAKSQTMEESQQKAVFLVMPLLALIIGQFSGLLLVSAWLLTGIGLVFAALSALFLKSAMRKFTYEKLLG